MGRRTRPASIFRDDPDDRNGHRFDALRPVLAPLVPLLLLFASSASAQPRLPAEGPERETWLRNMFVYHRFSDEEVREATGLEPSTIRAERSRIKAQPVPPPSDAALLVLPYPGGRHPRIGFLEGAVQPQRETKFSLFLPWDRSSYVVADIPEAIWSNLGLLYLAHSHVPTYWDKQKIQLAPLEWRQEPNGVLTIERTLPNGVTFGTRVEPKRDLVRMELFLTNGSDAPLSDLRVQNCILLKGARGFTQQTRDNKVLEAPYAACRSDDGRHWVITAWSPCHRAWANPPCPCLHSDPKFPDCKPGETQRLVGILGFYVGDDVRAEFRRLDALDWAKPRTRGPEATPEPTPATKPTGAKP